MNQVLIADEFILHVDSLLNDNLVDEALTLAQTARKPGTSKEDFVKVCNNIYAHILKPLVKIIFLVDFQKVPTKSWFH